MAGSKTIAKPVLVDEPGAIASPSMDGAGLHIGLVYTRHCKEIVEALVMACRGELLLKGVARANIHELEVMKPYDIPYAMKRMLQSAPIKLDAVVCIGCLARRQSAAFDFVAEAVTRACMKIGMKTKTPVIYGVLTCTDEQQARQCAGLATDPGSKTRECNFGVEWAQSAIDMGHMNRKATRKMLELCECSCHGASHGYETTTQKASGQISEALTKEGYPKASACGWCGHQSDGDQEETQAKQEGSMHEVSGTTTKTTTHESQHSGRVGYLTGHHVK
jgi:6,7-dimethyl-8-ribityllumazine synthase